MELPWHMQRTALENARGAARRLAAEREARRAKMQSVVLSVQQLPTEELPDAVRVVQMIAETEQEQQP